MLSPNLVFESSRSTLGEPPTSGPDGAPSEAPQRNDAMGDPVTIDMSSLLLRYLASKGSSLFTPILTRRWDVGLPGFCTSSTWAERTIRAAKEISDDAPSTAFAVRRFQVVDVPVEVALVKTSPQHYEVRPFDAQQDSECALPRFDAPRILLSAEILRGKDGRLLARIDDERPFANVSISGAVLARDWVKLLDDDGTTSWTANEVLCKNVAAMMDDVRLRAMSELPAQLDATTKQLFDANLAPLF